MCYTIIVAACEKRVVVLQGVCFGGVLGALVMAGRPLTSAWLHSQGVARPMLVHAALWNQPDHSAPNSSHKT